MQASEYVRGFKGGASAEAIYPMTTAETRHGPEWRRLEKWANLRARLEHAQAFGEVHGWVPEWPWPDLPFSGIGACALYLGIMNIDENLTYPRYWLVSLTDGQIRRWRNLAPRRWHVLRCTKMQGWVAASFERGGHPTSLVPTGFSWRLPAFARDPNGFDERRAAMRALNRAARHGWNANL
jgi:hypothetical protein